MYRKKGPILTTEQQFAEDRGISAGQNQARTTQKRDIVNPDSMVVPSPTHRKNAVSVDFRPSEIDKSRHKRSASEFLLTETKVKSSPKSPRVDIPMPLLQEESSSGMSDSEKVIRKIIKEREGKGRGEGTRNFAPPVELSKEFVKIKTGIAGAQHEKEAKRRALKQNILKLLSPTQEGAAKVLRRTRLRTDKGLSRESDCSTSSGHMSPEPKAQPLPLFSAPKLTNRETMKQALTTILLDRTQLRFELEAVLEAKTSTRFFVIAFKSPQHLGGLYGYEGDVLRRIYAEPGFPEIISQTMVEACYIWTKLSFQVLPHNRLSRAIDGVWIRL